MIEYPALYTSANKGSLNAQQTFLNMVRSEYALLFIASAISVFRASNNSLRAVLVVVLLLLLALLIARYFAKSDAKWYLLRALAESIKSNTWQFSMRAHPFEDASKIQIAKSAFAQNLEQIRVANRHIGEELEADAASGDQITDGMCDVRKLSLGERLDYYMENRVREQRIWYAKKAGHNKRQKTMWFTIALFLYVLCVAAVFGSDFGLPIFEKFVDPFIVVICAIFGWLQLKRHGELAASYLLTAHEIGGIVTERDAVETEEQFSDFVNRAEFAFSREHTQWAARKSVV